MKQNPLQRLTRRLADMGHAASPSTFKRTRAGRHQRAAGAWSWSMERLDGFGEFGSLWSVSKLLKAARLDVRKIRGTSDYDITPEEAIARPAPAGSMEKE